MKPLRRRRRNTTWVINGITEQGAHIPPLFAETQTEAQAAEKQMRLHNRGAQTIAFETTHQEPK